MVRCWLVHEAEGAYSQLKRRARLTTPALATTIMHQVTDWDGTL